MPEARQPFAGDGARELADLAHPDRPAQTASEMPRTYGERPGADADAGENREASGSLGVVPTLVRDPQPVEVEALIERRRRLAQDLFDEMWDGVLHMNPAPAFSHAALESQLTRLLGPLADVGGLTITGLFNLGESATDYRVPDLGLHRPGASGTWLPTAALVVEILSPDDETWDKLPFYAAHNVDEVLIVDPEKRIVDWLALRGGEYPASERSGLIELGPAELAERIVWP
jgi:hypothetical protein